MRLPSRLPWSKELVLGSGMPMRQFPRSLPLSSVTFSRLPFTLVHWLQPYVMPYSVATDL